MTARFYIYVYYQVGNVGSHNIESIKEQPDDGFATEKEAENHLAKLIEARKGYHFERNWYKFTILKTFRSKSALDDYRLDEKIQKFAETYHDREVMASTMYLGEAADLRDCGCCNNATGHLTCIEHDSQDYSKDLWICPDCYTKIATYWKEHSPKKICPV